MIQIVNIPITRDSRDYPFEEFLKGVEVGQETLNTLLDDGYTVLHSSIIKDSESQRLHFVLYKPTHLVKLDTELAELNAAMKPGNGRNGRTPSDADIANAYRKLGEGVNHLDEDTGDTFGDEERFTLTEEALRFLDELNRKAGTALD